MTRVALLLSAGFLTLGAGASAQILRDPLRDAQDRNAAAAAQQDARQNRLSSQIETSNANEQARTQMRLRDLETQRTGATTGATPSLRPLSDQAAREEADRRDAALSGSMDRMERLTQDALEQSNARMRAITPAGQPPK